jgi:hypothetical protein
MSSYVKATNFASKDALASGNSLKIVKGTEIDTEFNAIATAVNSKLDSSGGTLVTSTVDSSPVGATTPSTGAFTTLSATGTATLSGGGTLSGTVALNGTTTITGTNTITNPTVTNYTESVVTIGTVTSSSTIALTSGTVQTATLTLSTACTFTMPTATAGKSFVLLLKQAASTGNGTATFTSVKWGTSGAPTITATAGKMDILSFISDGTNWYGSIIQGFTP